MVVACFGRCSGSRRPRYSRSQRSHREGAATSSSNDDIHTRDRDREHDTVFGGPGRDHA